MTHLRVIYAAAQVRVQAKGKSAQKKLMQSQLIKQAKREKVLLTCEYVLYECCAYAHEKEYTLYIVFFYEWGL